MHKEGVCAWQFFWPAHLQVAKPSRCGKTSSMYCVSQKEWITSFHSRSVLSYFGSDSECPGDDFIHIFLWIIRHDALYCGRATDIRYECAALPQSQAHKPPFYLSLNNALYDSCEVVGSSLMIFCVHTRSFFVQFRCLSSAVVYIFPGSSNR